MKITIRYTYIFLNTTHVLITIYIVHIQATFEMTGIRNYLQY